MNVRWRQKMGLIIETLYWLPYCSTCTKAEQHLKDGGAVIKKYVNLKEEKLSKDVIARLAAGR
jgi:arsenate reductase (glutaredoxin)